MAGLIGTGVSDPQKLEKKFKAYTLGGLSLKDYANLRQQNYQKNLNKKIASIEQDAENETNWELRRQYEQYLGSTIPPKIAQIKYDGWVQENNIRKKFKEQADGLNEALEKNKEDIDNKITIVFADKDIVTNIADYVQICKKTIPKKKTTTYQVQKDMITIGERQFNVLKRQTQALAKEIHLKQIYEAKKAKYELQNKFKVDATKQKLAEIPMKIEEEIERIKKQLDGLLGKSLIDAMNPEDPKFDLDIIIAKLNAMINPAVACIKPLESVGGNSILGSLGSLISIAANKGDNGGLTKQQIKDLTGKYKPAIPQKVLDDATGIKDDIISICMMLPMIFINVILQMLNVIYSKLKIITSILPLGSFFPLNLIDSAITAVPQIYTILKQLPTVMYAMIKGKIKDKLAAAMALAVPQPNINLSSLESAIPEVKDSDFDLPACVYAPKDQYRDYVEINKQMLSNVETYGYTKQDLDRILYNYRQIYNGTNMNINQYWGFQEISDSNGNVKQYIPDIQRVTRAKPTADDYSVYLDTIFCTPAAGCDSISSGVNYMEIIDTQSLIGAEYQVFQETVKKKEPNSEVILVKKLEP